MQQSPDHTDDIRLIQAHRIIAGDGDLPLQTCTNYKDLFKRCLFTVGKQIAFSWWLQQCRQPNKHLCET